VADITDRVVSRPWDFDKPAASGGPDAPTSFRSNPIAFTECQETESYVEIDALYGEYVIMGE